MATKEKAPLRVYWDSCVFIDLIGRTEGRFDVCEACRIEVEAKRMLIVTSTMTLCEVTKCPGSAALSDEAAESILSFFENPYILLYQLDRGIAETAHRLARRHGLLALDAIHVATALAANVEVLHTYDEGGGRRRGLLRHSGCFGDPPGLRIEHPSVPTPGPLFS